MKYKSLLPQFEATANVVEKLLRTQLGYKNIRIEDEIDSDIQYRPTFQSKLNTHHVACFEISQRVYLESLDDVVIDCLDIGYPVKLWIVVRDEDNDPDYKKNLARARKRGVGVLELRNSKLIIVQKALSISLMALRPIMTGLYPQKYRATLMEAEQLFRDGEPEKACSKIYDELEALTRRIAVKATKLGKIAPSKGHTPWKQQLVHLRDNFNPKHSGCSDLNDILYSRLIGVTQFRNSVSHKVTDAKSLAKRDLELRTRFENAVDLFRDLATAAGPLRL